MGEVDFPQRLEAAALTKPSRGGGPFTNPIHAQHSRRLKGAGIEGSTSVGEVVLTEQQLGKLSL